MGWSQGKGARRMARRASLEWDGVMGRGLECNKVTRRRRGRVEGERVKRRGGRRGEGQGDG